MRSFIRSHRKTNSLDESPTGFIPPYNDDNDGARAPVISSNDRSSFVQSTPPQPASSNFQALKHSPGFESLQKFNKKMFPSKLFKKTSSTHSPLPQPHRIGTKEYSSAPGTPQTNRYEMPDDISMGRNSHDNKRSLAVKGTITHSWGDNSDNEPEVIVLNNNNGSNKDNNSQTRRLQSSTQPSTPLLSQDLGPAVRISSINEQQEAPSRNFHPSSYTPRSSTEENTLRQGEQQQPDVYSELSRVKNKNRQARIHSHDEIIGLGQDSSVTMDFLKSTFSPSSLDESSPDMSSDNNDDDIEETTKVGHSSNLSAHDKPARVTQRKSTVKFQEDDETSQDAEVEEGDTEYLTPAEKEYEEDEEYEDDEDDEADEDDDATSTFSFELNPINGRTSSVKYYSKPQPSEAMYIDDLYEDENFDEDMHCLEDYDDGDDDDETEFPSNRLDIGENLNNDSIAPKGLALNMPHHDIHHLELKPVKKYRDLFALSDEEESNDNGVDEDEGDDRFEGDHPDLAGFGLEHGTIRSSGRSHVSDEKRPLSSVSLSTRQSGNMESADKGLMGSPISLNDSKTDGVSNFQPNIQSPSLSQSSAINSSAPIHTSHTQPTPSIYLSAMHSQSSSPTKPAEINTPAPHVQSLPTSHVSKGLQQPLRIQPQGASSVTSPGVKPTPRPANISKNKTVKSFSDIFNLDDDFSDEDEDESDLIRETNAIANGDSSSPKRYSTSSLDNPHQGKDQQMITSPFTSSKTPVQIYLTPPGNGISNSVTPFDVNASTITPSLPPPARSQSLKYHDLSSNLDAEVPGMMSNLYFIDEAEEDKYMEEHKLADEEYLDEINTVPEDFNFSDSEHDGPTKTSLRRSLKGSFRGTHSYSSQPTGTAKENTPTKNKLEIKNKTVTFFNHGWDRSPGDRYQRSPGSSEGYLDPEDAYISSPTRAHYEKFLPLTPNSSTNKLSPGFINDKSLSPIQEGSSSVDNSPKVPSLR